MYIAPGQGQIAHRGQNFDVNKKRPYHFNYLLQVSKKCLLSDLMHFFSCFNIYIYSPGAGGYTAPKGTKFYVNRTCLSLRSSVASFKSQTTTVSEKSIFWYFFPYKSIRDQIWPCRKIGQDQQGHHLNKHSSIRCCIPSFKVIGLWFRRRRFFKIFTIYGHGAYLGHVNKLSFPIPWRLHMKFDFDWLSGLWGEAV